MLFLNLLNRIFGSKNSLQREDIDRYRDKGTSNEEKQKIEEKSLQSDFDADALEGFESQQLDSKSMSKLDNRFTKQTNSPLNAKVISIIVTLAASFAILVWILDLNKGSRIEVALQEAEQATTAPEAHQTEEYPDDRTTDDSEVIIEQGDLNKLDQEKINQISPVNGLDDAHEDIVLSENTEEPKISASSALAPKELFAPTKRNFTFQQQKELFMSDYKVVDYRGLREEKKLDYLTELQEAHVNNMEILENDIIVNLEATKESYYVDYLENAMYYLKNKNWSQAKKQFENILSTYPDDVNANFYMGYLHFQRGEFASSLAFFKKSYSYNIGNFREEALWLIAQAKLAMNDKIDAKNLLEKIVEEKGFYADEAHQKLKELK
jgi:TolA-binding protein